VTTRSSQEAAEPVREDEKSAHGPADPRRTDHPAGEAHAEDNIENEPTG
jgi:hypothetical protein